MRARTRLHPARRPVRAHSGQSAPPDEPRGPRGPPPDRAGRGLRPAARPRAALPPAPGPYSPRHPPGGARVGPAAGENAIERRGLGAARRVRAGRAARRGGRRGRRWGRDGGTPRRRGRTRGGGPAGAPCASHPSDGITIGAGVPLLRVREGGHALRLADHSGGSFPSPVWSRRSGCWRAPGSSNTRPSRSTSAASPTTASWAPGERKAGSLRR